MNLCVITSKIKKYFKNIHICYNDGYDKNDKNIYLFNNPNNRGLNKKKQLIGVSISLGREKAMRHISTVGRLIAFKNENKNFHDIDFLQLLEKNIKKISALRGVPTIAYLTAINKKIDPDSINISKEDIKHFIGLIDDIPDDVHEVDIILHSRGGYMLYARELIEILRNRFKKVNFLIPFESLSAAAMMCMSGDEIIMTPEASLGPFDVQMAIPGTEDYYPAKQLKIFAKEAKKAHSFLNPFMPKSLYADWDSSKIRRVAFECDNAIRITKYYTTYWLMKYFFKSYQNFNYKYSYYLIFPWWTKFTKNGRKAKRIVSFFMNPKIHIVHNNPIFYHEISDIGLNIKCANGELLDLMRETYTLTDELLNTTSLTKLYISNYQYTYLYSL